MVDEEIAKMLKGRREKENQQEIQEKEREEMDSLDEEEIEKQVAAGHLELFDREFHFKKAIALDGRISLMIPDFADFVIESDKDIFFNTYSDTLGYSCNLIFIGSEKEVEPMSVYKKRIEEGTKKSGIRYKWEEEGAVFVNSLKFFFLDCVVNTGLGAVHSCIHFAMTQYGRLSCTMNYAQEEKKYWKPIIKALAKTIEIHEGER